MTVRRDLRNRLVRAAGGVLATAAVGAVAKALNPDVLAAATSRSAGRPVSRPTAYRAWTNRTDAVVEVARHFADPRNNSVAWHLKTTRSKYQQAVGGRRTLDMRKLASDLRKVLSVRFEQELASISTPTGWVLQAAAMSSSAVWRGPKPEDSELEAVGREILAARGELYEHLTDGWSRVTRQIWAAAGRRPRQGVTVEQIVMLTQSLFDGCLLRVFIDPQLNDPGISETRRAELLEQAIDLAVDAIFEITWAFTESDRLTDPRRPTFEPADELFDNVVRAAATMYDDRHVPTGPGGTRHAVVSPHEAAQYADLPIEVATILFQSPADLVDSVLRRLVAPDGLALDTADTENPAPVIRSALSRLKELSRTHPRALAAAQAHRPAHPNGAVPFLDELTDWIAGAVGSPQVDRPEPIKVARTLMQLVLAGDPGWNGVEAILSWITDGEATRSDYGRGEPDHDADSVRITSAHLGPA